LKLFDGENYSNYLLKILIEQNYAPKFLVTSLPKWHVYLWYDKNGDLVQEEGIKYLSPSVSDADNDTVTMAFEGVPDFADMK
jgi:hypothetical protein